MDKTVASPIAPKEADKFNLRFPDGMRDRVAEAAAREGRSMNTQLIAYVEAGLDGYSTKEMAESIRDIKAAIIAMQKQLAEK